jgi:hypothetical protein
MSAPAALPPAAGAPAFRADVEGLRGAAILLVVLFHAGVPGLAGAFVGVDVFFVLSGFFITGLLARELARDGAVDLPAFYAGRALRLLPVLLVVLAATLAAVMWLYAPIDRAAAAASARAAALSSSNVALATARADYFSSDDDPLLHTWSLAVEQQFYLAWPLLLVAGSAAAGWLADRGARRRAAPAATDDAVDAVDAEADDGRAAPRGDRRGRRVLVRRLALADAHVAGVGVLRHAGAGVGVRDRRRARRGHGRATGAGGPGGGRRAASAGGAGRGRGGGADVRPLPAVPRHRGAAAGARRGGDPRGRAVGAGRARGARPRRRVAALARAHVVRVVPVALAAGEPRRGARPRRRRGRPAGVVGGRARPRLAHAPPGRAAGPRGAARRAAPAPAVGAGARGDRGGGPVAHAAVRVAERQAARPDQRAFAAARRDRMAHDCWATTADRLPGPCEFGDARSPVTVALLGDSHAEHWLGALDRAGRARGWKVAAMVKGGCPVADAPELAGGRRAAHAVACERYREAMLRRVVAMRPAAVVLSSYDHYVGPDGRAGAGRVSAAAWGRGLRRTYARLAAAGIPTVVIRGTPRAGFDVPACLSRRAAGVPFAGDCTYDRAGAFVPAAVAAQTAAARGLRSGSST